MRTHHTELIKMARQACAESTRANPGALDRRSRTKDWEPAFEQFVGESFGTDAVGAVSTSNSTSAFDP